MVPAFQFSLISALNQSFLPCNVRLCPTLKRNLVPNYRKPSSLKHRIPISNSLSESDKERADDQIVDGPFDGHYGQWYLTKSDVDEVRLYRFSLVASAALASLAALPLITTAPSWLADLAFVSSNVAFGISLWTIHIYMKPLHNALKVLYFSGLAGYSTLTAYIAFTSPSHDVLSAGALQNTPTHPVYMLAIGWTYASLTGLFFKEAICFGKTEALLLFMLTPVLAGGHFLQIFPSDVERTMAIVFSVLFVFFSISKFSLPETSDLGDKSVFEHYKKLDDCA